MTCINCYTYVFNVTTDCPRRTAFVNAWTVGRYAFHSVTNLDFETYWQQLPKPASWSANQHQAGSRDLKKCGSDIRKVCSRVNIKLNRCVLLKLKLYQYNSVLLRNVHGWFTSSRLEALALFGDMNCFAHNGETKRGYRTVMETNNSIAGV